MKIEIGKKYRNRLGHEVHITSYSDIQNHPFKDADGNYYTDDGHYIDSSFDTERDLVALIITLEEPVSSEIYCDGTFEIKVTNNTDSQVFIEKSGNDLNILSAKVDLDTLPKVSGMAVAVESAPYIKLRETPSSNWHKDGEADPHDTRYDCERGQLEMGHLTDDQLANAFYTYNHRTGLESEMFLNAAKSRIRWLSRALEKALEKKSKPSPSEAILLAEIDRLRGTLKCIATQAKTKHLNTLRIIEINATQALRKEK